MATEDDAPGRDHPSDHPSSDSASNSGSDDDSDSGEPEQVEVEWLATTRARRSTAGNRMKSMLANEEPADDDDDLELLFAEDGDDAGFTDAEKDDSDVHMDSSSDDEDADDAADDDAGEKELERQAREKRNAQRKRKAAQAAIPVKFRKKVRIEQPPTATASASPAPQQPKPRPKKKSERASWLPTPAEMPTRASERQTTKLSKEQLHQQMLEREIKRKKVMEAMERKAKKMEALKKPPLTQAQRLAEAAAVEKRNAKSLNRWEEAEKQREEERLRKIAALQNRKLDGPVVTFWSGIQELDGDQMKNLGKMVAIEEKAPRKKRQSLAVTQEAGDAKADADSKLVTPIEGPAAADQQKTTEGAQTAGQPEAAAPVKAEAPSSAAPPPTDTSLAAPPSDPTPPLQQPPTAPPPSDGARFAPLPAADSGTPAQQAPAMQPPAVSPMQPPNNQYGGSATPPSQPSQLQPPRGPMAPPPIPPPPSGGGFLAAPSMLGHPFGAPPRLGSQMPRMGMQAPNTQSHVLAAPGPARGPSPSPLSMPQPQPQPQSTTQPIPPTQGTNAAASSEAVTQPNPAPTVPTVRTQPAPTPLQPAQGKAAPVSPNTPDDRTPAPAEQGKVTRSCIILQNFDENAIKDKQVQTQILFGRKMNKLASEFSLSVSLSLPPLIFRVSYQTVPLLTKLTLLNRTSPPPPLRDNQPPSPLPRPQDGTAVLQQLRLPRDPAPAPRRLPLEPPARRLGRQRHLRRRRGAEQVPGSEPAARGGRYSSS